MHGFGREGLFPGSDDLVLLLVLLLMLIDADRCGCLLWWGGGSSNTSHTVASMICLLEGALPILSYCIQHDRFMSARLLFFLVIAVNTIQPF